MNNLYSDVTSVFNQLDIEVSDPKDSLEYDLGMDSQEVVTLIYELEKKFEIQLEANSVNRKLTVSDLMKIIQTHIDRKVNNGVGENE